MTDAVGLNTNYNLLSNNTGYLNTSNTPAISSINNNSIFNTLNTTANSDYYGNDMFMSGIDFSELAQKTLGGTSQTTKSQQAQTSQAANSQTQTSQTQMAQAPTNQTQQQAFTGNNTKVQTDEINPEDLKDYLVNKDQTQETTTTEVAIKKSNKFKFLGALGGLIAPIVTAGIDGLKKGNFKNAFKLKELAITCPIIGVTGFAAGLLLDGLVNSSNAKKAQETEQAA